MVPLLPVTLFIINPLHQPPERRYPLQTNGWIPHWGSYFICLLPPITAMTRCHINMQHHTCTPGRPEKLTQHSNKVKCKEKLRALQQFICPSFFISCFTFQNTLEKPHSSPLVGNAPTWKGIPRIKSWKPDLSSTFPSFAQKVRQGFPVTCGYSTAPKGFLPF